MTAPEDEKERQMFIFSTRISCPNVSRYFQFVGIGTIEHKHWEYFKIA